MISVDEALARVLALAPAPQAESIRLSDALGRILLEPAIARMTQPPFNAAAMDGYALRNADARPGARLRVIGEAAAGHEWRGEFAPGHAVRIFTGAPVPPGLDRVVMQEDVTREGDEITLQEVRSNLNIRPQGNDFKEGDSLAPGRLLGPADLGLLAAMNLPEVTVARRPRVAIIAGGDELVAPGTRPGPGQIICSNDLAIAGFARQAGADTTIMPTARDTIESLTEVFAQAADSDLIVTIGGASVGDHDLIGKVSQRLGMERAFYKIAMRPGKPLIAGRIGRSAMLGLPGNPVSAMTCGIVFMQPLIWQMQGYALPSRIRKARLRVALPAEGPRQHYQRAKLLPGDELPLIEPYSDQDSARMRLLAEADALLIRPARDPARDAGEIMEYIPLRP